MEIPLFGVAILVKLCLVISKNSSILQLFHVNRLLKYVNNVEYKQKNRSTRKLMQRHCSIGLLM